MVTTQDILLALLVFNILAVIANFVLTVLLWRRLKDVAGLHRFLTRKPE